MRQCICARGVCLANASFLRETMAHRNASVYLGPQVCEIKEYAVGYTPALFAKRAKNVHLVRDCGSVGNLRTVIWRAWDVCMKL